MSCPFCDAKEVFRDKWETRYACGTKNVYDYGADRSEKCKENEAEREKSK